MNETIEIFERLSVALAVGLLIGLERGWSARNEEEGERAAGLRTLALIGLSGGVWGIIAGRLGASGGIALGIAFAVVGATLVLFRFRETIHDDTHGATTAIAGLIAFALGALAALGETTAAAASGVAVAGLLALKTTLHAALRRMTWIELRSVLVLFAMTFLLLPILPRRAIDPLGTINPYEIWLMAVLIAAISFAGYIAVKLAGARQGIALTGLAGGLAASTATTVTLARLAREHPERGRLLAGGALIAGAVMMVRVLAVAGLLNAALIGHLAPALLLAAFTSGAGGLYVTLADDGLGEKETLSLGNPLDLIAVLKFGALLAVVGVLAQFATRWAGTGGLFLLAAFSGLADVDALTLSMARLAGPGLAANIAAGAILIAVAVNTATKSVLGWSAGGAAVGRPLALISAAAIAAGAIGYALGPLALPAIGR
jgi:uncharacterized membrane protein (DUF4010 family)